MSSSDYTYDDQAQFFPFFILTIAGLVTLPLSYSILKPSKELETTAPRIQTDYKTKHDDLVQKQKARQKRRERKIKRISTVVVGYTIMAYMVYLIIVTARAAPKIWDPYEILGVSRSADEKAISRHYKRLSLTYHPDKIRPDPAKNETIESLNDHFVELTKAYKALTDEEIRQNYLQYGNPDGKQSFSIGIALPKFIVTDGNGKYVLMVYGVLLGVLLPYVVGKWWYGTQRVTKERVLVASAGNLFREFKEDISQGGVVGALSSGEEYKGIFKGTKSDSGLKTVEKTILAESDHSASAGGLAVADKQKLLEIEGPARRKALALLWAYLGRVELGDASLENDKLEVAPVALALGESFAAISLAFGWTLPILNNYHTSQNLIQAIAPGWSPLLQLPFFTPKIAQAIEGSDSKTHLNIKQFMDIPDTRRRNAIVKSGLLSSKEYETAISVAKQIPSLTVSKAFFKVMGEKVITPSSLVQFVVKARFIPPGTTNVPEVKAEDLEDVDPDEGDLDALLARKSKAPSKVQPPLAHAPYFPRDHSPRWHIFLADNKQGKMAVPPFTFTTFDKPIFDDAGKPTYEVQTLKMQFQAPPQVGAFTFVMHLICDSYIGLDTKMEVTLNVEDAAKAEELVEEDEISEPEEDSIAGQMQALKTGGLAGPPPSKKKAKKISEDSSEDDSSDTDGEVDDTSDTDTETEDEED